MQEEKTDREILIEKIDSLLKNANKRELEFLFELAANMIDNS